MFFPFPAVHIVAYVLMPTYLLAVSREATGIRPSVKIDTTNPGVRTVLNAAPDGEIARTANWTHFTGWCSSCPSNVL